MDTAIVEPRRDESEGPVPHAWRSTIEGIVLSLIRRDFVLATDLPEVQAPVLWRRLIARTGQIAAGDRQDEGMDASVWSNVISAVAGLVGAAFGGFLTLQASKSQRKHEVAMAREARVRDRAGEFMTTAQRMAFIASSDSGMTDPQPWYALQESADLLVAEAVASTSDRGQELAGFVSRNMDALAVNLEVERRRDVGDTRRLVWEVIARVDSAPRALALREGVMEWLEGKPIPDFDKMENKNLGTG